MSRILIIDDDIQVRAMLRQMLERSGYDVTDAPDGEAGMMLQREEPAELVITDIIMPDKEGIETIMELRKEFPAVKIIAISGGGRIGPKDYLEMAERLGASRTMTKPILRQELLDTVCELLKQP